MSSLNLTLWNLPHRKVKRVQIRAAWGIFIFGVILEPCDGEESCWRAQFALSKCLYVPSEAVQLLKCSKCNAGCSVSLLKVQNLVEISQWLWLPPTPSQKVDSGVGLLSCLPLIHLYSKLYHFGGLGIAERQISSQQWTPNWAPFLLSWDSECVDICQVSYVREWLKVPGCKEYRKVDSTEMLWRHWRAFTRKLTGYETTIVITRTILKLNPWDFLMTSTIVLLKLLMPNNKSLRVTILSRRRSKDRKNCFIINEIWKLLIINKLLIFRFYIKYLTLSINGEMLK